MPLLGSFLGGLAGSITTQLNQAEQEKQQFRQLLGQQAMQKQQENARQLQAKQQQKAEYENQKNLLNIKGQNDIQVEMAKFANEQKQKVFENQLSIDKEKQLADYKKPGVITVNKDTGEESILHERGPAGNYEKMTVGGTKSGSAQQNEQAKANLVTAVDAKDLTAKLKTIVAKHPDYISSIGAGLKQKLGEKSRRLVSDDPDYVTFLDTLGQLKNSVQSLTSFKRFNKGMQDQLYGGLDVVKNTPEGFINNLSQIDSHFTEVGKAEMSTMPDLQKEYGEKFSDTSGQQYTDTQDIKMNGKVVKARQNKQTGKWMVIQ